jgi:autotransporter-associated beta strand protein
LGVADNSAAGTSAFNFNGGTLQARVDNPNFLSANQVTISANGAVIDTQSNNITISQILTGSNGGNGSLRKIGSGSLVLSGPTNSQTPFTGAILVEAGSVGLPAFYYASSNVVVSSNAALDLSQSRNVSLEGSLELKAGSKLKLGNPVGTAQITVFTAFGGIAGNVVLDQPLTSYALTNDGYSLILNPIGVDAFWIGGTNGYNDSSRWGNSSGVSLGFVPRPTDAAIVDSGEMRVASTIGSATNGWSLTDLTVGHLSGSNGKVVQSGGLITLSGWSRVGDSGTGLYEISGGTNRGASWLRIGEVSNGTVKVSGTANLSSREIVAGSVVGSTGVLEITSGEVSAEYSTFIGLAGTGAATISGGILRLGTKFSPDPAPNNGALRIGHWAPEGVGVMNLSGQGTVEGGYSYTGVGGIGQGTLNISGGTWNQPYGDMWVGHKADSTWTGSGRVNQSGGTNRLSRLWLGNGSYHLDGGILSVGAIAPAGFGTNSLHLNGGVLQASGASTNFNSANFLTANTVLLETGGAILDTQTNNVTINQILSGVGGLTKRGSGILNLAGANSYSGSTTVQEGTLRIQTANFVADVTSSSLAVAFTAPPTDGQLEILPGTLNGNPTVTFSGLAAGQSGVFSSLSGKATFTTTSLGVSFSSWSGNQTLTSELLCKYAIGGATGPSAASVAPVVNSGGGVLTLSALVRTNSSSSSFAVLGEYSTNLISWSPLTNNPSGVPSADTNGVPEGFQRRIFTLPIGPEPKKFLHLKSTL